MSPNTRSLTMVGGLLCSREGHSLDVAAGGREGLYLGLDDPEQVIQELPLSYLHVETQTAVLDTRLQHLREMVDRLPSLIMYMLALCT